MSRTSAFRPTAMHWLSMSLILAGTAFGACKIGDSAPVKVQDLPLVTALSMPIGERRSDLGQLEISSFINFNYPKISFGKWYVATAHNSYRYLNNAFAEPAPADRDESCGMTPDRSSLYHCDRHYHPGEDWNLKLGSDAGEPVYAIADGRVLFRGNGPTYGSMVIILYRLDRGQGGWELVATRYAHMNLPSTLTTGSPLGVCLF